MCSDVEQLARSVERVSLSYSSRQRLFRTPSFTGEDGDGPSFSGNGDVDMSDVKDGNTEDVHSSHKMTAPNKKHIQHSENANTDLSTKSYQTSPVSLRRGGRPSSGIGEELSSVIRDFLLPSMLFFLSHAPSCKDLTGSSIRILGKILFVLIPITQVLRILMLSYRLFRATMAERSVHKDSISTRRRASRASRSSGRWVITAVDRIDNIICKVLVCLLLVGCRICIILLCISFLSCSSTENNAFITTGLQTLDRFARIVLDFSYAGVLNANIDGNVLQECKTIPELVFENQHMCT